MYLLSRWRHLAAKGGSCHFAGEGGAYHYIKVVTMRRAMPYVVAPDIEFTMEERLREAVSLRDLKAVQLLISNGAKINDQNRVNGWSALHWAAKRKDVPIVRILLESGADPTLKEGQGLTPAQVAEDPDIAAILNPHLNLETPSSTSSAGATSFKPNYLQHPTIHKEDYYMEVIPKKSNLNSGSSPPAKAPKNEPDTAVKILKIRMEGEKDFIEIDLMIQDSNLDTLIQLACQELQIHPESVNFIRKLPNTKLRKDKEVQRLVEFQELELVLLKP